MNSVRELARHLGLSHTTVSDALRNNPRVKKETRERVLEAAEKAGYRYNPLAGALMSEMRKSGAAAFHGVLAVVDLESSHKRIDAAGRFHSQVYEGAKEKANQQGFKAEVFVLGDENFTVSRLDSILTSRGIRGLLLLPNSQTPDISNLRWDNYAGVYTDYLIDKPALDSVCADHFRSMMLAMGKIREYGYKRPGFVLEGAHDKRLLYRWEAAFRMFNLHDESFFDIEPYIVHDLTEADFRKWFEKNQPDIVLSHRLRVKHWMEGLGLKIPADRGFCSLNVTMSSEPVSGLNLGPREIGMRAMELLIGKLHRNDYGMSDIQMTATIPAQWIDGPTMRQIES